MKQKWIKQWTALSLACCALLLSACGRPYSAQSRQLNSEIEVIPFTPALPPAQPAPAAPAPEATATATQTDTATKAADTATQVVEKAVDPTPIPLSVKLAPAPQTKDTDEAHQLGDAKPNPPSSPLALLRLPDYHPNWGMGAEMYERVKKFYTDNRSLIHNPDYVIIVDFSKRSSEKRFFIFDLRKSRLIKLHTTHGTNSDPLNTGFATEFSNTENSLQSSLGFFLTLESYEGINGYSLRLRGLEGTNSNAEKRGVVIHSAPYVNEELGHAGRSWGCLALDPKVSRAVINHIRGGALLYIGK